MHENGLRLRLVIAQGNRVQEYVVQRRCAARRQDAKVARAVRIEGRKSNSTRCESELVRSRLPASAALGDSPSLGCRESFEIEVQVDQRDCDLVWHS